MCDACDLPSWPAEGSGELRVGIVAVPAVVSRGWAWWPGRLEKGALVMSMTGDERRLLLLLADVQRGRVVDWGEIRELRLSVEAAARRVGADVVIGAAAGERVAERPGDVVDVPIVGDRGVMKVGEYLFQRDLGPLRGWWFCQGLPLGWTGKVRADGRGEYLWEVWSGIERLAAGHAASVLAAAQNVIIFLTRHKTFNATVAAAAEPPLAVIEVGPYRFRVRPDDPRYWNCLGLPDGWEAGMVVIGHACCGFITYREGPRGSFERRSRADVAMDIAASLWAWTVRPQEPGEAEDRGFDHG